MFGVTSFRVGGIPDFSRATRFCFNQVVALVQKVIYLWQRYRFFLKGESINSGNVFALVMDVDDDCSLIPKERNQSVSPTSRIYRSRMNQVRHSSLLFWNFLYLLD